MVNTKRKATAQALEARRPRQRGVLLSWLAEHGPKADISIWWLDWAKMIQTRYLGSHWKESLKIDPNLQQLSYRAIGSISASLRSMDSSHRERGRGREVDLGMAGSPPLVVWISVSKGPMPSLSLKLSVIRIISAGIGVGMRASHCPYTLPKEASITRQLEDHVSSIAHGVPHGCRGCLPGTCGIRGSSALLLQAAPSLRLTPFAFLCSAPLETLNLGYVGLLGRS